MQDRALRTVCRRFLRSLRVEPPLELLDLVARVAEVRGRPILTATYPLTDGLACSWSAEGFDVIAWRPHTSPWHRDQSIAHELGHCLCGHIDPEAAYQPPAVQEEFIDLYRTLTGSAVHGEGLVRRACDSSPHEAVVEQIATTFLRWATVPEAVPSVLPAGTAVARTLAWRRAWL